MTEIEFKAHVPKNGKLTFELPEEFHEAEVEIHVKSLPHISDDDASSDERPWTDEELKEFQQFEGKTGAEIASSPEVGAWSHLGITDSQEWVEEVRRQEEERRKWPRD